MTAAADAARSDDPRADAAPESWSPWCRGDETHSGAVVLLGDRAYKVKKPVDLGFLDFRERDERRRICQREVDLNRRLSPDVYLGVGTLQSPDGSSEPAVVMRRLPDRWRLSHLVRTPGDHADDVRRIARTVAAFHLRAPTGPHIIAEGTRAALRRRWDANLGETATFAGRFIDADTLEETSTLVHRFLDGRADLFDDRIRRGAVVDGHGDLTPEDIFCLPDGPRLLDCLEFDDRLRYVDRLDDIAFLAMGLEHLGAADDARVLLDTWAEHTADPAPPSLIHHYIAYRAFVRVKVGCLRGRQRGLDGDADVRSHAARALAHLRAGAVTLVLVGGPPGSGKSTVAGAVADRLGMSVVSSDRVRKEASGIAPTSSAAAPFEQGIYDARHTEDTYAELLRRARLLLGLGESVVVDASWTRSDHRRAARMLAEELCADLVELRCTVDADTAAQRIAGRRGVSDADAAVAVELRRRTEPWPTSHPIDTARSIGDSAAEATALIRPPHSAATWLRPAPSPPPH
jgi:aminoglycoside phosphotransferase family enzyme/predicted kinase